MVGPFKKNCGFVARWVLPGIERQGQKPPLKSVEDGALSVQFIDPRVSGIILYSIAKLS